MVLWAMGTEEYIEAKSLYLAYLYKIIKVLKVLGSVIEFNLCPIGKGTGHFSLGAWTCNFDTQRAGKKTLGITRATALTRLGTTALREVTCPVIFRKSCLSG